MLQVHATTLGRNFEVFVWRLEQVKDSRNSRSISNEKLLNAPKFQAYSIHSLQIVKGKIIEEEGA